MKPCSGDREELCTHAFCKKERQYPTKLPGFDYVEVGELHLTTHEYFTDLKEIGEHAYKKRKSIPNAILLKKPDAYFRYHYATRHMEADIEEDEVRTWNTPIWFFYGSNGAGKTHDAKCIGKIIDPPMTTHEKTTEPWWEKYRRHEIVVINEIHRSFMPWYLLNDLAGDAPDTVVPVKHGHRNFLAKLIIITSDKFPERWYTVDKDDFNLESVYRRYLYFI